MHRDGRVRTWLEAVSTRSLFLHSLRHPGLGLPASRTGRIDVCCLSPQPAVCVRAPEQRNTALRSMQALFPDPVILGVHRPLPTSCCPGSAADPGPASPCSRPLHLPQGPPQMPTGPALVPLSLFLRTSPADGVIFRSPYQAHPHLCPNPHLSNKAFPQKQKL